MEKRLYFLFGDVLASSLIGVLAGLAVSALIGPSWPMLIGMLVGMALGMLVSLLSPIVFTPLFGAHEVMIPSMLAGMLSGMVVGMGAAMQPLSAGTVSALGALIGVGVTVLVWIGNAVLHGEQQSWTS